MSARTQCGRSHSSCARLRSGLCFDFEGKGMYTSELNSMLNPVLLADRDSVSIKMTYFTIQFNVSY